MNEPMQKYMKVGIVYPMAYPRITSGEASIEDTIKKIALDDYFDAIEIVHIPDLAVRRKVSKIINTAGLTVSYGGGARLLQHRLNVNHLDEGERQKAVACLREGIDEAFEVGAVDFAFLSGPYNEDSKEKALLALVQSTKELCAYAKARGNLMIVLEVFDYDVDKKSLIGPVCLAKRFAEAVRKEYDNFGLMVDLSHLPQLRESASEAILPIKDFLVHVHIGNCVIKDPALPGYGDQHPRFGFPESENGCEQLVDFLKMLFVVRYLNDQRPIVSFEVKPFGDEDPDLVIANAKRTLNLAWAKLGGADAGLSV